MKLTRWYPPNINPVHKGVYEIKSTDEELRWFRYWDGRHWHVGDWLPTGATLGSNLKSTITYPHDPWRGLVKKVTK